MHPPIGPNKAKDRKSIGTVWDKMENHYAVPTCYIPFGVPGVVAAGFEFANGTITVRVWGRTRGSHNDDVHLHRQLGPLYISPLT
jgi:hypothetical protein